MSEIVPTLDKRVEESPKVNLSLHMESLETVLALQRLWATCSKRHTLKGPQHDCRCNTVSIRRRKKPHHVLKTEKKGREGQAGE